jgi:hypothetical protein
MGYIAGRVSYGNKWPAPNGTARTTCIARCVGTSSYLLYSQCAGVFNVSPYSMSSFASLGVTGMTAALPGMDNFELSFNSCHKKPTSDLNTR